MNVLDVPDPTSASPEVVFRMLTPIFKCSIVGASRFTHEGNHGGARFEIELRPYTPNPTDWAEVTRYADDGVRQLLVDRVIHVAPRRMFISGHFLLTDVIHPASGVSDTPSGTMACAVIQRAVTDALRLHSSAGIVYYDAYGFRSPPPTYSGLGIHSPNTHQTMFSHLVMPSVLRNTDFGACRFSIDVLMKKSWREDSNFDRLLSLAMEYHRLSFTLERVDHAFLVLMVAFEAMFKKEEEDNATKASQRIGRLLGSTKQECMRIQKEFFNNTGNWFCKVRNGIAHGEASLSLTTVADLYSALYRHVTGSIVKLLNLHLGDLDETKNYYDEISKITENRFLNLPNT